MDSFSLIPGIPPSNPGPLSRFLPPLEDGVGSNWLLENIKPGSWVLDPFGSAPRLSLEAARAGYRVLVTANNPVTRFILEIGALSLPATELNAAIADLAVTRKGKEKLEDHLQALYLTTCASCEQEIPAQAFLWRKGERAPFGRIYECAHCGEIGEKPATAEDEKRAAEAAKVAGLARARVLERVVPLDSPDRQYAEEAIQHYLPRTIYALATLINRLDSLQISEKRRQALTALILSACDRGNALWPHPTERPRPKQLSMPSQFYERNIWFALEESIDGWAGTGTPIPCLRWSSGGSEKLPKQGGILLYEGRIKKLANVVQDAPIVAVIGSIPRPNQAFWTLCALWAGWLWGREAAEPFLVALRRRRYDWGWQATALHAALHHVFGLLPLSAPFFGLLTEAEPGLLTATLTAASTAGFDLRAQAMRTAHDYIQLLWQRGERLPREKDVVDLKTLRDAMHTHLVESGEPATYLQLFAAGLLKQAQGHGLMRPEQDFDEALREVGTSIQQAIQSDSKMERIDSENRSLEVGMWDLPEGEARDDPLADRVERAVVNHILKRPSTTLLDIERSLYPEFPGLLTPSRAMVSAVLESYAVHKAGRWSLREEDQPSKRRAEIETMLDQIDKIGQRLEYKTEHLDNTSIAWIENDHPVRVFYLLVSAITGPLLEENKHPMETCLLVLPGGRAGLLAYKQRRDPKLLKQLEGWKIVKFRLVRALAEIPVLNRQTFEEQLVSDPIEQTQGQMMMF